MLISDTKKSKEKSSTLKHMKFRKYFWLHVMIVITKCIPSKILHLLRGKSYILFHVFYDQKSIFITFYLLRFLISNSLVDDPIILFTLTASFRNSVS